MLLGEANMWPEDVRDYFGDGDECHMAYHFPLMPRMYMAIAQEDRHPIVEIMEQTPDIPDNCQWAIFLRNHDELTLEMVTSRERDYMYQMYAADPRARLNLGIRRRLAPLMENDPERIKLMNSLLLSMPGSPIIYYGDEIGMGDNVYLGDRNGVRTPMQWSPDRNAGFSRADPQQLYLPPIMDPIYGYEAVNVEAQTARPLLAAQLDEADAAGPQDLAGLRPRHAASSSARAIARCWCTCASTATTRSCASPTCRARRSRWSWICRRTRARCRSSCSAARRSRRSASCPISSRLPSYGFYWFKLSRDVQPPAWHEEHLPREDLPVLVLIDGWKSLFPERVAAWRSGAATKLRAQLEERVLPRFIATQRWFAGKGAPIEPRQARRAGRDARRRQHGSWACSRSRPQRLRRTTSCRSPIVYEGAEEARWSKLQAAAIARVRQQATVGVLAEASADESFCRALIEAIGARRRAGAGARHAAFLDDAGLRGAARRSCGQPGNQPAAQPGQQHHAARRRDAVPEDLSQSAERRESGSGDRPLADRGRALPEHRAAGRRRRISRQGRQRPTRWRCCRRS